MTLPEPVPLDPPPGDPVALAELVSAVTGAAFRAGVLAAHLAGPAAAAPGWLGADAAAAAGQLGAVAGVVRRLHAALTAAEQRLRQHAGVLDDARRRIAALRRAQEEDFAVLRARLVALADPDATAGAVDRLVVAEAGRRAEHTTLLAEVGGDTAATARVLTGATAELGGTGAPGQEARVRVALAAVLPGWGDAELVSRAWSAAAGLDGPVTAAEIAEIAREGLPYAGNPAYAGALLANLGVDGVRWLLTVLGQEAAPSDVLARWLATAFGAARAAGPGPLADVLDAEYVDPDDPDGVPDQVASGLAALLTAVPAAAGGVRAGTAASWGVQMLARERRQGVSAAGRARWAVPDPVEVVVGRVAASGDASAAGVLLAGREAWDALLARGWDDGAAALAAVVGSAAAPGPAGESAVRSGLAALGNGLSPGGPGIWTVDRTTAEQIAPALAAAVTGHVGVAVAVLGAAGAGDPLPVAEEDVLRGLGYLTLAADAAAAVQAAVDGATSAPPLDPAGTTPTAPADAVAVRSALVAAREYAQRLDHALDGYAAMSVAVDRELLWDVGVNLPIWLASRAAKSLPAEMGVEAVQWGADRLAAVLGADGTWEIPPDTGLVFDREDAAAAATGLASAGDPVAADLVARQARAAFDRAARTLGVPLPPAADGQPWDSLPDSEPGEQRRTFLEHMPRRGAR